MGRHSKDKSADENIRGHLRQAKSEIKHLKKQLERAYKDLKRTKALNDIVDASRIPSSPEPKDPNGCPNCGKKLNILDFGIKKVVSCSNRECGFRKTEK